MLGRRFLHRKSVGGLFCMFEIEIPFNEFIISPILIKSSSVFDVVILVLLFFFNIFPFKLVVQRN